MSCLLHLSWDFISINSGSTFFCGSSQWVRSAWFGISFLVFNICSSWIPGDQGHECSLRQQDDPDASFVKGEGSHPWRSETHGRWIDHSQGMGQSFGSRTSYCSLNIDHESRGICHCEGEQSNHGLLLMRVLNHRSMAKFCDPLTSNIMTSWLDTE